jgi:uncharacterized protein YjbI with pentapeptide repeats
MSKLMRDHLRSNVVGYVAVFIALSGVAYAAGGGNTVGSKDIINGQVKSVDVRDDTLKGGGLTGADLGPDSVAGSELAADSVAGSELSADSVGGSELAPASVGFEELMPGSVRSTTVQDESLEGIDIFDSSLSGIDIFDSSLSGADIDDNSVTGTDIDDNSLSGADIDDNSVTGTDIDESTLAIVPEADKVDGADLCRVRVSVALNSQSSVCTSGSLSLFGACAEPASTPPFTPTARLTLDSAADDAFVFNSSAGGADFDAATPPFILLSASPPSAGANSRGGSMNPIAAGGVDGSRLFGVAVALAIVGPGGPGVPDGHCEFVVSAIE